MKYIVYCTINNANNYLYVGVHQTENPDIYDFYLGENVYANNADSYKHPKTKFQYAVKEFGIKSFRRHTIAVFDNKNDAYYLEGFIVNETFLARTDVYNTSLGGINREIKSTEIKVYSYDLKGNFIKEYSSINSAAKINKVDLKSIWNAIHNKISCKGYYWTDVKYEFLDLTHYKNESSDSKTTIYQYNDRGEYECAYASASIASRLLGIHSAELYKAIKLGIKCADKYFSSTYAPEFHRAKSEQLKNTPIHQYELMGIYIKSWKSPLEAQHDLEIKADLCRAIKLGQVARGYQWSHELLPNMPNLQKSSGKPRKVGQYDMDDKLIKVYETVSACKKENGSGVQHVLSGRDLMHKGLKYKYIE